MFSLSLLMIDRAGTSPARGTTKHAVPAANNDQDSIQALTVFAITFCGKSIAFNAFEQRLRKLFVNFMKLINSSWRTDDVRDFGKAGRPSLVLLGHLLLSNDPSMVFEVAQEAFMPPAVARLRSELNAIVHTICSM